MTPVAVDGAGIDAPRVTDLQHGNLLDGS